MTGCTSTTALISGANNGSFPVVNVAAKDFTTLGFVFTENTIEHSRSDTVNRASGEVLTYHALLKEAEKLGADAIVNVTIDAKIDSKGSVTKLGALRLSDTEQKKEIWYGSALAIKYTNKLTQGDVASVVVGGSDRSNGSENNSGNLFSRLNRR
jgi:hypothetical protein